MDDSSTERMKGRWFVAVLLLGCSVGAVNAGLGVMTSDPSMLSVGLAWLASCMWFGSVIRSGAHVLAERARGFTAVGVVGFAVLAGLDGGLNGGAVMFLALMPLFSYLLVDRAHALRTAAAVVAVVAALAVFSPAVSPGVSVMTPDEVAGMRGAYLLLMALALVGLAACISELQRVQAAARDEAIATLKSEIADVRKMHQDMQKSNQAKSVFLANISHELRTPLNAIVDMTEATLPSLEGPSRQTLDVVLASSRALLATTDDLVDLSRIETGRVRLDPRSFDLRRACDAVVMSLAPSAAARRQALVLDVDEDVLVTGDEARVKQVLTILIRNAVKHAVPGTVTVLVNRTISQTLRFEVTDLGPGLAPELHASIFDPFHEAEDDSRSGPGLGLSIARALVGCMDGTIGVESSLGTGSTFWFELPLPECGVPVLPQLRMRVGLAVPGDHPYRQALTRQLMLFGCDVVEVGERPEIIMSPMGSGDGLECRAIGRAGHLEHISLPWRRDELMDALRRFNATVDEDAATKPDVREQTKLTVDGPILVVEDNEVNRIVARRMLEALGCIVHTANDGFEALERLDAGSVYALVFMDIQMPGIDGYETTRRIRSMKGRRVPIVALTANALPEHRAASLAAGMDDHVAKPVRRDVLAAALTRWAGAEPEVQDADPFSLV